MMCALSKAPQFNLQSWLVEIENLIINSIENKLKFYNSVDVDIIPFRKPRKPRKSAKRNGTFKTVVSKKPKVLFVLFASSNSFINHRIIETPTRDGNT